jgi:hypothetical protein
MFSYQQPPPPPPRKTTGESGWGFRKLFGIGSKQNTMPSSNYYAPEVSCFTNKTIFIYFSYTRMKIIMNHPFVVLFNNRC